jgi:hypothetical protein
MTTLTITATVTDADGNTGTGTATVAVVIPETAELAPQTPPHGRHRLPDFAERARQAWNQVR